MKSLCHVAPVLYVKDLALSVAFYRDRLGFDLEFEYEGFYAGINRDDCRLHPKQSDERTRSRSREEDEIDVSFGVRDAAALASEFEGATVAFSVPLREMPYGREFYVTDLDGNVLAFVETHET